MAFAGVFAYGCVRGQQQFYPTPSASHGCLAVVSKHFTYTIRALKHLFVARRADLLCHSRHEAVPASTPRACLAALLAFKPVTTLLTFHFHSVHEVFIFLPLARAY